MEQKPLFEETLLDVPSPPDAEELLVSLELTLSPDLQKRLRGFHQIRQSRAHVYSPLISAQLANYLDDPELAVRKVVVELISEALEHAAVGTQVWQWMRYRLDRMRQREIYGLLQVMAESPAHQGHVIRLLKACPYSGETMIRILTDRSVDVSIRRTAAETIAQMGYLEAIDTVERLINRIAARRGGQRMLSFVPVQEAEAEELLPALQSARDVLEEAAQ